jgi:hypothetical protein
MDFFMKFQREMVNFCDFSILSAKRRQINFQEKHFPTISRNTFEEEKNILNFFVEFLL